MDSPNLLLCATVLFFFNSCSTANGFSKLSPNGEVFDDGYEHVQDGVGGASTVSDFIILYSNISRLGQAVEHSTSTSSQMSEQPAFLWVDNYGGEGDPNSNSLEESFNVNKPLPAPLFEEEGMILNRIKARVTYGNQNSKNFQANERDHDESAKRDSHDWKDSGVFKINNYDSRDRSLEYYEGSSYLSDKYTNEVGAGYPQFHQKNYFYNFYPLVNDHRYTAPIFAEIYETDGGSRGAKISGPYKSKKRNPCRQYLEFLRYVFQKLDKSVEYQDNYNEYDDEWRDAEPYRTPNVLGTRLLGPTLYSDNSERSYQFNARQDSIPTKDKIFPFGMNALMIRERAEENPSTPPNRDRTSQIDLHKSFSSASLINSSWSSTDYFKKAKSTEATLSGKHRSKTIGPAVEHSDEIKGFEYWWKALRTNKYVMTQTVPYNLDNSTERTGGTFENYDFYLETSLPITTAFPITFNSEEYYSTWTKLREKGQTLNRSNFSFPYWFFQSSNFEKTTMPMTVYPVSPAANTFNSKTLMPFGSSVKEERKDGDCFDQMLPCPDTFNITYPLNGYCNRYVSCESGRAIRKTCPEGLHFNIVIKSCDLPHNSICTYSCPESNGYFGVPGDCNGYFVCKNYVPEYRMCPPRMHWDPQRRICTFADLSRCPMKCVKGNEVKHYEGDCKAYIVCLNGLPFYHKCPPNTKFNGRSLSCVPDRLSTCEDDPRLLTKNTSPNFPCKKIDTKAHN